MKKYKFLIVTPSYNQGTFIKKTIQSVLSQDYACNYIVIDGGSTDNTVKVLKKFGTQLEWISEKDAGQTAAINKGIRKLADTIKKDTEPFEYIFAYINSDDYYLPGAFKTVVNEFEKDQEKSWLVGEYTIESVSHNLFHNILVKTWKTFLKLVYSKNLLLILNPIAQPSTFIKWKALKKNGIFNEKLRYVMDYEYWLRLQSKYGNPIFLSKCLSCFRIHEASKGGSQFKKQFKEQYDIARRFTKNTFLLALHKLHNWFTIQMYSIMK